MTSSVKHTGVCHAHDGQSIVRGNACVFIISHPRSNVPFIKAMSCVRLDESNNVLLVHIPVKIRYFFDLCKQREDGSLNNLVIENHYVGLFTNQVISKQTREASPPVFKTKNYRLWK